MVKLSGWNVYVVRKRLLIGELRCSEGILKKGGLTKVLLIPNLRLKESREREPNLFGRTEREKER